MKRGTQHWSCNVPTLLVYMDSASTCSELLSETGLIADLDIRPRHVDLDSSAVTALNLLNIMSLYIDIIYTSDIFRLQSSDMIFGALLYLA